ncbi:valine--tRNA ligase [Candidatus Gottesmanbacteria bacterium]|nr:valine--tRNA ligase [Candidatus Gottesmanbacteria bacterium]
MDKTYNPKSVEEKIYQMWESGNYFSPRKTRGKLPFSIVLPPPNANADLHLGHAMYVIEDIMIRYHRMKGDPSLWLPGADHAGFETQYVFEKQLVKEGKNRFDYPREELYQMIWDFVQKNRGTMENQLRRLGFSLDWSRNTFTLDPNIVEIVYKTFKKLYDDGLVYRGTRLVNYCTRDGTGFSDLEVKYVERNDPLYYMKYGPFTIATARPETKFRDTALAVNPKDKRYKDAIGKTYDITGLLGPVKMTVIPDPHVDPAFGTGIMKVTPAHDPHDFELGQKFNLPVTPIINFRGRMDFSWFLAKKDVDPKYRARAEIYHGKKVAEARALMVEDLKKDGLLVKVDEQYIHRIGTCYKCGTIIEPLPMEQWFVKVKPLADASIEAIKKKKLSFVPKRFEKRAIQWLTDFHDWNISRQIVWGIRIPAWKCLDCKEWTVTAGSTPTTCSKCKNNHIEQDTDTFDTWFSSGQWPFATLRVAQGKPSDFRSNDFDYFYPTSVMETGYDILPWWVCRMIMLGIYATGDVPFHTVYLHGLVRDSKGQKMSKSRGNVINPLKMIDQYGADSLRMSLVYGTASGNDQSLSEDKIRGMRNFANKVWNIGRFIMSDTNKFKGTETKNNEVRKKVATLVKTVTKKIDSYQFGQAAQWLYEFTWHTFADSYIEDYKKGEISYAILFNSFIALLKLLHPFMPFVTEAIWSHLPQKTNEPLIISHW